MKLASIDIGTNSTRLMIAKKEGNHLKTIYRGTKITRLGESVDKKQVLLDSAIQRTLLALRKYQEIIESHEVDKVKVAATSAMRDARNSPVFIDKIKEEIGFYVEILAGKEEAKLSFLGATYDFNDDFQPIVVIDIGGGSTELIFGKPSLVEEFFSLDIGSVRLTEMFVESDPPLKSEIQSIEDYIHSVGRIPFKRIGKGKGLLCVGLAGTITTLSAISQQMEVYDSNKIHGSKLSTSEIESILNHLLSKDLSERRQVVGLEKERADIIITGTVILKEIMKTLDLKEVTVSEHDILDGLILSIDT